MRISDSDRDRAAELVRLAAGEGRLSLAEVDTRLQAIYAATTYADLDQINRDLPSSYVNSTTLSAEGYRPLARVAMALLGGFERRGAWIVPKKSTCVALLGSGYLDLRDAVFASDTVEIRAFAVMGGVEIILPENAELHLDGVGVMGGFDERGDDGRWSGGPRVVVSGLAFWGGVTVRRSPSDDEVERRKVERKRLKRQRKRELESE